MDKSIHRIENILELTYSTAPWWGPTYCAVSLHLNLCKQWTPLIHGKQFMCLIYRRLVGSTEKKKSSKHECSVCVCVCVYIYLKNIYTHIYSKTLTLYGSAVAKSNREQQDPHIAITKLQRCWWQHAALRLVQRFWSWLANICWWGDPIYALNNQQQV